MATQSTKKKYTAFSTGSAMEKWLRVMALGQRSHAQARFRVVDAHRFSRHSTEFFDSNKGEIGSFRIDHSFMVQYGGIHGFFSSEGVQGFSAELTSVVLIRAHTPSGSLLQ
jgi:DNA helicase HerA-like ATPase